MLRMLFFTTMEENYLIIDGVKALARISLASFLHLKALHEIYGNNLKTFQRFPCLGLDTTIEHRI